MTILVTGAAGFIGFHTCKLLLARGERIIGVDDLNDYYDVRLKHARLDQLKAMPGFAFHQLDVADRAAMTALADQHPEITRVIHLAAQAGVRYSLVNPYAYTHANIEGQMVVLEMCRHLRNCEHLVYASSSSVYGANTKLPFAVEDRVDTPVSLYAATKKAAELMSHVYSHLYRLPTTGLRFFTVYGPWGRPDMAAYLFTKAIMAGEPIRVFNGGDMNRDFTFVDDIVAGVIAVLDHPPHDNGTAPPYKLYNIGNHKSEPLMRFIGLLEQELGRKAELILEPMQPGDVKDTYADITAIQADLGFEPTTPIDQGIPRFVAWYKAYHGA